MADRICHIEIGAKDLQQAGEFYSSVFGWNVQAWGAEYLMFNTGEDGVGGAFDAAQQHEQRVVFYIAVEDIDAKLQQIEASGGKVIVPKTVISEEVGYFAHFKDPAGVLTGLWSAE